MSVFEEGGGCLDAEPSQIHSITICSNVTTGASDLLRMVKIIFAAMRFLITAAFALMLVFSMPMRAMASDTVRGAQIFNTNCAACHAGGGNIVKGERTLQQADLEAYLPNYLNGHENGIVAQVTYGRNAMPAFLDVLSENEIADVAAYVEDQASHGWS